MKGVETVCRGAGIVAAREYLAQKERDAVARRLNRDDNLRVLFCALIAVACVVWYFAAPDFPAPSNAYKTEAENARASLCTTDLDCMVRHGGTY